MRIVIQRVSRASVCVDGSAVSQIGCGLMILVGVENGDTEEDAAWLASKAARLRIFDDERYGRGRRIARGVAVHIDRLHAQGKPPLVHTRGRS